MRENFRLLRIFRLIALSAGLLLLPGCTEETLNPIDHRFVTMALLLENSSEPNCQPTEISGCPIFGEFCGQTDYTGSIFHNTTFTNRWTAPYSGDWKYSISSTFTSQSMAVSCEGLAGSDVWAPQCKSVGSANYSTGYEITMNATAGQSRCLYIAVTSCSTKCYYTITVSPMEVTPSTPVDLNLN